MSKRDLIRRIDQRPTRSGLSLISVGVSGSVPTAPAPDNEAPPPTTPGGTVQVITDRLYVGRYEGPHVGLFRLDNDSIFLQAVDTANTPFFSVGAIDYEVNSTWLRLGYAGSYGIRLRAPAANQPQPEQEEHRPLEIDAECLVGTLPADVMASAAFLTDADGTPVADDDGNLIYEAG